jgi:hypothetical protein
MESTIFGKKPSFNYRKSVLKIKRSGRVSLLTTIKKEETINALSYSKLSQISDAFKK